MEPDLGLFLDEGQLLWAQVGQERGYPLASGRLLPPRLAGTQVLARLCI